VHNSEFSTLVGCVNDDTVTTLPITESDRQGIPKFFRPEHYSIKKRKEYLEISCPGHLAVYHWSLFHGWSKIWVEPVGSPQKRDVWISIADTKKCVMATFDTVFDADEFVRQIKHAIEPANANAQSNAFSPTKPASNTDIWLYLATATVIAAIFASMMILLPLLHH
jgi:hypothetical protein